MRFFVPTQAFWNWLKSEERGTIIDVGCGDGALLIEMDAHGFKCLGIDPMFDSTMHADTWLPNAVIPILAEKCPSIINLPGQTLLICRPCHDGFPGRVATMLRQSPLFYVGFEKNLERDLGGVVATLEYEKVGMEGECVWRV